MPKSTVNIQAGPKSSNVYCLSGRDDFIISLLQWRRKELLKRYIIKNVQMKSFSLIILVPHELNSKPGCVSAYFCPKLPKLSNLG